MPSPISNLCLAATPCVEQVEILHCASHWRPDPLDDLVALLHNESTFLPAVHVVKLGQCAVDISASSLAAMLTSRCDGSREGIAKLESFQLLFDPNAVPIESIEEIRSRLRRLREMGLYSVVGMADK
ncbi:hypothetical protein B0H11DRAFT_2245816 [Mycena galericulata]|nr:hypothetical protein B0H11DRAFT_2245816 [Mycena galericulata]